MQRRPSSAQSGDTRRAWLIQAGSLTTTWWWTFALAGAQAQPDRRRRIRILLVGDPRSFADLRAELPQAMALRLRADELVS
jgi:alpha-beta hydrolase superfamily lysophospholipase